MSLIRPEQYFRLFLQGDIEVMKGLLSPIKFVILPEAVAINAIMSTCGSKKLRISLFATLVCAKCYPCRQLVVAHQEELSIYSYHYILLEEKKSTETRKSQLCPLAYWMNVAKSYHYLFYTPNSLHSCNFVNS